MVKLIRMGNLTLCEAVKIKMEDIFLSALVLYLEDGLFI